MELAIKQCYQTGSYSITQKRWKLPKCQNRNETFWVTFKQGEIWKSGNKGSTKFRFCLNYDKGSVNLMNILQLCQKFQVRFQALICFSQSFFLCVAMTLSFQWLPSSAKMHFYCRIIKHLVTWFQMLCRLLKFALELGKWPIGNLRLSD